MWVDTVEPLCPRYLFMAASNERQSLAPVRDLPERRHHLDFGRDGTHNFLNAVPRVGLTM